MLIFNFLATFGGKMGMSTTRSFMVFGLQTRTKSSSTRGFFGPTTTIPKSRPQRGGLPQNFRFSVFSDMFEALWRSFRCKKLKKKMLLLSWLIACWHLRLICNFILNQNLKGSSELIVYRLIEVNLNQTEILHTGLLDQKLTTLFGNFSGNAICGFCNELMR